MSLAARHGDNSSNELPFYQPQADEVALFEYAYNHQLPMLIKGPTGCGKTRFISYMAARLGRLSIPLPVMTT